MKNAALLAKKHAQLKTLTWDLNRADEATGVTAHAALIGKQEFTDIYDRISAIDDEVATKRKREPTPPSESITDKTKRIAYEGKKKLTIEALLSRRKMCLRELGERLRDAQGALDAQELHEQLKEARNAESKVTSMKREIATLSQSSPRIMKKVFVFGVVVTAALLLYWTYGYFVGTRHSNDQSSLATELKAESSRIKTEMAELKRKRELEAEEREARRELETQKSALEREKQKAEADKELEKWQAEADKELEKRRAEADKKVKEVEIARLENEKRQHKESEARLASAQLERQILADALFEPIVLNPANIIQLSRSLNEKHKASVELRGPKYRDIVDLHKNRDWLGLINLLTEQSFNELPDATKIESAADGLKNYEFTLLVKSTSTLMSRQHNGPTLHLVTIPFDFPRSFEGRIGESSSWQRHPNGIGYLHTWKASDGYPIVVLAPAEIVRRKVHQLNQEVQKKVAELRTQLKLGEIDQTVFQKELSDIIPRVCRDSVTWAKAL
jgi:hypothetical protein